MKRTTAPWTSPIASRAAHREAALAKTLGAPAASLSTAPAAVAPGGTASLSLAGADLAAGSVRVRCPPLWKASARQAGKDRVDVRVQAPPATPAAEARIHVQLLSGGAAVGELTVPIPVAKDN